MFHHFHGEAHPVGQGSISGDDFEEMIEWLSSQYNLLSSNHYLQRLEKNELAQDDICLSFDDALLCQAEIAVPILNRRNIQAFFFIYSSPFVGQPDPLEIYRYFRTIEFRDIEDFYSEFFQEADLLFAESVIQAKRNYVSKTYLSAFPFYSENDKWFRFMRDQILGKEKYDQVMDNVMKRHSFDRQTASSKLWMSNTHLESLRDTGHTVGLHSFSHPTMIHTLPFEQQRKEYFQNFEHLNTILGHRPFSMSHPCGNYSNVTLEILKELGIRIGFRSSSSVTTIRSPLEIPRDDHANVMKQMKL